MLGNARQGRKEFQEGAIREPISLGLKPLLKQFFSLLVFLALLSLILKICTFTIRRDSDRTIAWVSTRYLLVIRFSFGMSEQGCGLFICTDPFRRFSEQDRGEQDENEHAASLDCDLNVGECAWFYAMDEDKDEQDCFGD